MSHHLTASASRSYEIHDVGFHSFACTATGARELAAWCAEFPPDTPGQPHRMSREEVLFVLDGALHVDVDDDRFVAEAGDAVLVPAHATVRIGNHAESPARAWVTTRIGMTAEMAAGGPPLAPPWAQ